MNSGATYRARFYFPSYRPFAEATAIAEATVRLTLTQAVTIAGTEVVTLTDSPLVNERPKYGFQTGDRFRFWREGPRSSQTAGNSVGQRNALWSLDLNHLNQLIDADKGAQ